MILSHTIRGKKKKKVKLAEVIGRDFYFPWSPLFWFNSVSLFVISRRWSVKQCYSFPQNYVLFVWSCNVMLYGSKTCHFR